MAMLNERILPTPGSRSISSPTAWPKTRGWTPDGRKVYTLFDLYPHADLVTYPSLYRVWECVSGSHLFRKPVVFKPMPVTPGYDPLGFKTIEMDQLVTRHVVEQVRAILSDAALRQSWAETNYALCLKYFSYAVARRKLTARLANLFGEGV
jgi:hypothetical protein